MKTIALIALISAIAWVIAGSKPKKPKKANYPRKQRTKPIAEVLHELYEEETSPALKEVLYSAWQKNKSIVASAEMN